VHFVLTTELIGVQCQSVQSYLSFFYPYPVLYECSCVFLWCSCNFFYSFFKNVIAANFTPSLRNLYDLYVIKTWYAANYSPLPTCFFAFWTCGLSCKRYIRCAEKMDGVVNCELRILLKPGQYPTEEVPESPCLFW